MDSDTDAQYPTFAEMVEPSRTALLVVGVQRFFVRTEPGAMYPPVEAVLETLRRFIDACRSTARTTAAS